MRRSFARDAAPGLALLAAGWALTFAFHPWSDERVSDVFLYHSEARLFLDGLLPYRDVPFEYPPLGALAIALPALGSASEEAYRLVLGGFMLALAAAVVVLTGRAAGLAGGDRRLAMLGAASLPLLVGAVARTHFDTAPAALAVGGLVAIASRRPATGFALLGLGAMTKGFPLMAAPAALTWLVGRGERAQARRGALALVAVLALVGGAALALSPSGALDAVSYHVERPVQVESAPGSVLFGIGALGGPRPEALSSHRSDGLGHPLADALVVSFAAILVAVLVLLAALAHRPGSGARELLLAGLGSIAAFAALGKVLSPQYLVWLAPLLGLAFAWRLRALSAALSLAMALTLAEFPALYSDVVAQRTLPVALVVVRNAALIAVVALVAWELAPRAARGGLRWRRARAPA
jgi:hypothetical protein